MCSQNDKTSMHSNFNNGYVNWRGFVEYTLKVLFGAKSEMPCCTRYKNFVVHEKYIR